MYTATDTQQGFLIRKPFLWLSIAVLAVYAPTFFYGLTELDDHILILHSDRYNEHWYSLLTAFHRGVFELANGHYYRPVFSDSIILNYQLCGRNIAGYHIVNVLLHLIAVFLLYIFYKKLNISEFNSFILTLLFAIHPVLSQAVAWIPGRNDVLLAIFTISFFITGIRYADTGKATHLATSGIWLLLAFFTKESALFAPVALLIILILIRQQHWLSTKMISQYMIWVGCIFFWGGMRALSHVKGVPTQPVLMVKEFIYRTPVVIQYIGKIFFPFNLSVYPSLHNTGLGHGITSIIVLIIIFLWSKYRQWRVIWTGFAIFFILLIPVLFLPHAMSVQTFEHRLYLPMTGFLLMLSQSSLFNNEFPRKTVLIYFLFITAGLAGINYYHQRCFASPVAFWTQAAASTPDNAHPLMVLAMKSTDPESSYRLFQQAYAKNPNENYINYCRGVKLQEEDSVLASEKFFIAEKRISNYYECDYFLARVAIAKGDNSSATALLQNYLLRDPNNSSRQKNSILNNPVWLNSRSARAYAEHCAYPRLAAAILNELGYK